MAALAFLESATRIWWLWLLRGIFAILFGILAFANPALTLVSLVLLYGVYALADGVIGVFAGATSRAWWLVLFGILGIIVGFYTFVYPGVTAFALLFLIAGLAIARGISEIVHAIRLRKEISNEWWLILSGAISIIFGIVLIANPGAGALAMIWVIGAYALVFGVLQIVFAFRLRGLRGRLETAAQT